jgi:hypothetical protein
MFEIIMLFGFLYAATCQLLPEKSTPTRAPQRKKGQSCKQKNDSSHLAVRKDQSMCEKVKNRSHNYAHAA